MVSSGSLEPSSISRYMTPILASSIPPQPCIHTHKHTHMNTHTQIHAHLLPCFPRGSSTLILLLKFPEMERFVLFTCVGGGRLDAHPPAVSCRASLFLPFTQEDMAAPEHGAAFRTSTNKLNYSHKVCSAS